LLIPLGDGAHDTSLWHRARRVVQLADRLTSLPELSGLRCDRRALAAAASFVDSAWADDAKQGRIERIAILLNPMDTRQRELSADILRRESADQLPPTTLDAAIRAIRETAHRQSGVPEALVLMEAVELHDLGPIWLWQEVQRAVRQGRDPFALVAIWRRHEEYGYWEARLRERLRFESTRRIARQRLSGLAAYLDTLSAQLDGSDLDALDHTR
jgi:hypothetical protein